MLDIRSVVVLLALIPPSENLHLIITMQNLIGYNTMPMQSDSIRSVLTRLATADDRGGLSA